MITIFPFSLNDMSTSTLPIIITLVNFCKNSLIKMNAKLDRIHCPVSPQPQLALSVNFFENFLGPQPQLAFVRGISSKFLLFNPNLLCPWYFFRNSLCWGPNPNLLCPWYYFGNSLCWTHLIRICIYIKKVWDIKYPCPRLVCFSHCYSYRLYLIVIIALPGSTCFTSSLLMFCLLGLL